MRNASAAANRGAVFALLVYLLPREKPKNDSTLEKEQLVATDYCTL